MALDPKVTVAQFFKDAWRQPDGKMAYAVCAMFIALVTIGLLGPLLTDLDVLRRLRGNVLPMLVMPFLTMGWYAWLNGFSKDYAGKRWINAVLILLAGGMFLWLSIVGNSGD